MTPEQRAALLALTQEEKRPAPRPMQPTQTQPDSGNIFGFALIAFFLIVVSLGFGAREADYRLSQPARVDSWSQRDARTLPDGVTTVPEGEGR